MPASTVLVCLCSPKLCSLECLLHVYARSITDSPMCYLCEFSVPPQGPGWLNRMLAYSTTLCDLLLPVQIGILYWEVARSSGYFVTHRGISSWAGPSTSPYQVAASVQKLGDQPVCKLVDLPLLLSVSVPRLQNTAGIFELTIPP